MADGYIYVRVYMKAFCTRKECKLRDGQTIHFHFYLSKLKLLPFLVVSTMVAGKQIATCFSVKKKCLRRGHNPPPLSNESQSIL